MNAFVWRIKHKKNWVSDRSICTHCKHVLAPIDLIPIASWLFLKGKCRYCRADIGVQYPLVEIIGTLLFGLSYAFWPDALVGVSDYFIFTLWLVVVIGSLALAVYDIKWMLLPNKVLYPVTFISVLLTISVAISSDSGLNIIKGALLGAALLFGFFYIIFQISGGRWIGGGDVKLGILLGLIAGGVWQSLLVLFLSSLIATIFALPFIVTNRLTKTSKIPFGPFLLLAMFIVKLFGAGIIDWYASKILLLN